MAIGSSYMQRTQTAGNQKTWTVSMWVKRGDVETQQCLMSVEDGAAYVLFKFNASEYFEWRGETGAARFITTRVFRDPAAWYHIVVACDTTESVEADRFKIYVNGVQETDFGTETYPALNSDTYVNKSGGYLRVGSDEVPGSYLNGSMSWVQLVDGLALAPTEFGSVDATSGIWKIKPGAYATPGTNGFCLAMEDRSNLDLDTSSNAHTFTTTGNITANYDNPSNNFCTINPLDNYLAASTFSNGNNTLVTHSGNYSYNTGTMGLSAGLWYWEEKIGSSSSYDMVGIADNPTLSTTGWLGYYTYSYGYRSDTGQVYTGTSGSAYGGTYTTGDIIGVYLDLTANKLYFAKNGTLENSGTGVSITAAASTTHGHYLPGVGEYGSSSAGTYNLNFGNGYFGTTAVTSAVADEGGIGAFEYDPSAGTFDSASKDFRAICTKNIKAYGG